MTRSTANILCVIYAVMIAGSGISNVAWGSQESQKIGHSLQLSEQNRLAYMLKWGSTNERIRAAETLSRQSKAASVKDLIRSLTDSEPRVRTWAAWGLGQIGDPTAVEPILRVFIRQHELSRNHEMRSEDGKCMTSYSIALEKLTGEKFGLDVSKWRRWAIQKGYLKSDKE